MCVACLLFHTPTQCIFPREARNARDRHYAGAHYRRHQEKDKFTELNMNTGDDETESISSISTLHSRNTDTQGGLNCGARFKQINERLNRQDKRINEISQKVDNVASAMKNLKNDGKADFAKFEAREEARINTGSEEIKHFMVQLLKEELGKLGHGNRTSPGASPSHG